MARIRGGTANVVCHAKLNLESTPVLDAVVARTEMVFERDDLHTKLMVYGVVTGNCNRRSCVFGTFRIEWEGCLKLWGNLGGVIRHGYNGRRRVGTDRMEGLGHWGEVSM